MASSLSSLVQTCACYFSMCSKNRVAHDQSDSRWRDDRVGGVEGRRVVWMGREREGGVRGGGIVEC